MTVTICPLSSHALKLRMLRKTLSGQFSMSMISENHPLCSSMSDLDEAFVEEKSIIVIKNTKLGNKIVLWIRMGYCLDKLSLVAAAGSIICSSDIRDSITKFAKPFAITAVLMHTSYFLFWSHCPLMQYR